MAKKNKAKPVARELEIITFMANYLSIALNCFRWIWFIFVALVLDGGGEEEVAHDLLGASVDFCAMLAEEEQDWGDEEEETSDPDDECGDGSEDGEEDD